MEADILQAFPDILQNGVLKNFAYFTGRHQCWSFFLIKLQVFRPKGLQFY